MPVMLPLTLLWNFTPTVNEALSHVFATAVAGQMEAAVTL
jgi:hypothetical protein